MTTYAMNVCKLNSIWILAVLGYCLAGCTSDSSQGNVEGTVTLDGQPLTSGIIRFVPVDGRSPTADATITEGAFSLKMPVGAKRVQIMAPKVVGKRQMYQTPDSPTVDIVEELLPARYNVRSELTIDVKPGTQQGDYELVSSE
jgi:hypothetical protein